MIRVPRLCSCGNVVPHGERCECQKIADTARKAKHDQKRPPARKRGYDHRWRKASKAFLSVHPYCAMPGCSNGATVVDHIIPHKGDEALFWNRANWQPLCAPCHNSIKQRQERSL